jgi:(1->4)-alpha-D-glucan 1-alpha-D-glucosylmutase
MLPEGHAQPPVGRSERLSPLLEEALAAVRSGSRLPESTYRLQFHAGFTFRDAQQLVPYLHDLGITDCYASPYLKARPGSTHGYAISDHRVLNPEIGTEADYEAWVQALQARGLGQILDIVPNHMGIIGNENPWWNDVLENGPCSPYAGFFDIDWHPVKGELDEKVLLCILGDPYGKVLEAGQLSLSYEAGAFFAHYFDHRFPVSPESYLRCLRHHGDELEHALPRDGPEFMEFQSIVTALSHLPARCETDPLKVEERHREKEVIKRRLAALTDTCGPVRAFIEKNVACFNGKRGHPHSFDLLDELLGAQAYRLAFWRVAADEINYRRFFDVNELAALSAEKPEVFAATHSLILRLLAEGKINGLRIDHLDGLYDPRQYLERLQEHVLLEKARQIWAARPDHQDGEWRPIQDALLQEIRDRALARERPLYVLVEKILGKDERIPDDWPIHGTTGYELLNVLNGLFVDPAQEALFSRIYQRWTGMSPAFHDYVYQKKFLILQVALSGELHMLAHQLDRLSEKSRSSRDFTLNSLRHALREIIACFPVYRSYITSEALARDRLYVEAAVRQAKRRNPAISSSIFDFVRDMLLLRYPEGADERGRAEQRRFVGKFQQVTGPVMAKGLEDTSFYVFNRLLSLNDVGGDPGRFGVPAADLHHFFKERQRQWPHALSATSTHDTKRSEDARARLNVLTEMPREWLKRLTRWKRLNKRHRADLEGLEAPDRNDEYLLYQTLVGAWPVEAGVRGQAPGGRKKEAGDGNGRVEPARNVPAGDGFVKRICEYMTKAVHEAKVHSSWVNPNPAYDDAVRQFVVRILDEKASGRFLEDFRAFQARIGHYGLFNSLSQTLLKIAAPGVPDFYQGTELWDFSLVDPDNRRPVDYERRQRLLHELQTSLAPGAESLPALARQLVEAKEDGRIKLYLTYRGLHCRRQHPALFTRGEYVPILAHGERAENVFAFIRRLEQRWVLAAAPRFFTRLAPAAGDLPLGAEAWRDSVLLLPGIPPRQRCRNIFTGEAHTLVERSGQPALPLADVFAHFPVALLVAS